MKNPPEIIWGNQVNLSGLLSPIPLKYVYDAGKWWHDGDFSIKKLGLQSSGLAVTFASTNKEEVQIWTDGVRAVLTVMSNSFFQQNITTITECTDSKDGKHSFSESYKGAGYEFCQNCGTDKE